MLTEPETIAVREEMMLAKSMQEVRMVILRWNLRAPVPEFVIPPYVRSPYIKTNQERREMSYYKSRLEIVDIVWSARRRKGEML